MFVRFRSTAYRLQASLIETCRTNGIVRQEHIASLGSVPDPPSIADRLEFWRKLHERLAKISNRVSPKQQMEVLAAVHARVPMATPDDQRRLHRENAEKNVKFWSNLSDMHRESIEGHKSLAARTAQVIASGEAEQAKAEEHAKQARERIERIDRGEHVEGGLSRVDVGAILREAGFTDAEIRRCVQVHEISEAGAFEEYLTETKKRMERAQVAAIRAVHRRRVGLSSV